ncbi:MAG: alpha/beta fold hydrolase [Sphingomonadales bacterium]
MQEKDSKQPNTVSRRPAYLRWSLAAGALILIGVAASLTTFDQPGQPNLPAPTLGGMQVWADEYVAAGWRLQENLLTGHYRLLDADNTRRAWGDFAETLAAYRQMQTSGEIGPQPENLVILLHGLGGWGDRMEGMRQGLEAAGFAVEHINYPSSRRGIFTHARQINRVLNRWQGVENVTFVAHSMGGLVLRLALESDEGWNRRIAVDGIVMIGVPNKGAALADALADNPAYKALTGQAGQDLRHQRVQDLPALDVRYCVIAGSTNDGQGINPLIPGDDDGMVAVAEVPLAEGDDFLIIESNHLQMPNHPSAIEAVLRFLDGRKCAGGGVE